MRHQVIALLIATTVASHAAGTPSHPLDPLAPAEIESAIVGARKSGFDASYRVYAVHLSQPEKQQVLAWEREGYTPPSRAAILWLRQSGSTFLWEVQVSVAGKMISQNRIDNVQPPMRGDSGETGAAQRAVLADPRVATALKGRGLTPKDVLLDYDSVGNYPGVVGTSPREAAFEFYAVNGSNMYSRPLGIMARVDLDRATVLSVYDGGLSAGGVPPEAGGDIDPAHVPSRPEPPRPFLITRPEGVSFAVDGYQASWQNWNFHVRPDWRVGMVLSMLRYNDTLAPEISMRSVAYEMYVSEMFVPYQLNDKQWYYRTFLDAGEFGMGSDANRLTAAECGGGEAHFFDLHDVDLNGTAVTLKSVVCLFERWTGDPIWLQGEVCQDENQKSCTPKQVRSGVELVVRTVPRVGNYDYVCDMVFRLDGSVHFKIGATGIDAMKAMKARKAHSAGDSMAHAMQMDGFRAAPFHDHFFNYRLDLDIDAEANQFVLGSLKQYTPDQVPRMSMWGINFGNVSAEAEAKRDLADSIRSPEVWTLSNLRRVSPATKNAAGYTLVPSANAATLMHLEDPLQQRAAFTKHHLWATPYQARERYAAGDWPNQRKGGLDGLDAWTAANRSIEDTDVVLWYTVGFHHVTLQENLPVLPTYWGAEFDLMPTNFFSRNPALDLPPAKNNLYH